MIQAALQTDLKGSVKGFTIRGHAGWAEAGSDIVCAAVSCLGITCANALESVAGVQLKATAREGNMRVSLVTDSHDAQVILQVLRQGLMDLKSQYPDYIQVTISENVEE